MPTKILTAQLLRDFDLAQQADAGSFKRGNSYYRGGRVEEPELMDAGTAVLQVSGDSGEYEVEIRATSGSRGLSFTCDCPYADSGAFCKHMVAAGLTLADYLAEMDGEEDEMPYPAPAPRRTATTPPVPPRPIVLPPHPPVAPPPAVVAAPPAATRKWQSQVGQITGAAVGRHSHAKAIPYVGLVVLERQQYYGYGYGQNSDGQPYTLTPFIFAAADWPALPADPTGLDPAAVTALLETDRRWARFGHALTRAAEPAGCLNLNAQAVAFLNVVRGSTTNYYGQPLTVALPIWLPVLAQFDLPLFLGNTRTLKIERRLRVLPSPVDISLDLRHEPHALTVLAGVERDGQFTDITPPLTTINRFPPWVVLGDVVAELRDPGALSWLNSFPMQVPAADADTFRAQYLPNLARRLPFRSGAIEWDDVQAVPVPRLYLRDDKQNGLAAQLKFGYGAHEVPALKHVEPVTVAALPDIWALARIHRDAEREDAVLQSLGSKDYGLKRADGYLATYGNFTLRARVHPFDFLLHSVPQLAAAGVEIFGEEALKIGKLNRSTPTLRVSLTSGIDWFDLKAMVAFGEQEITLQEVRKALQRGERFIKLADGSAGQIPADWLEKYKHLWGLATETADGYRLSEAHLPLLDPLLEADPEIKVPKDLLARRNRLRQFEHIASQPLPANFQGELRPYQKHGVDWLHFLRDYKFGGILADDMGLGKTIQTLAFLQLLKERAGRRARPASLLVVPKSLIANWQREAEKFTPGLRFLRYLGIERSKDTADFKGQDVVLTTYGTMLRDVERLRSYRFNYVILDESQAIKNPLAKSAKAARLLQADHRLVMTGTPVENNSLELWSQFAFLNPGLLGSLDYFRRAFAVPIESHGDEEAAATLRSLVYPFILRRTKAQVAPELPPRTERIIYADMDPAQAKLYARTRARYQAELLGLIESQGMNDARFKILEGLLRLRQIAIHPKLVEPRFQGEAPKLELLLETLETLQAEDHKVLVFSQFVGMLKLVRQELDARGMKYVYLDGRVTDRQARVDQFQTDPAYPFFLISLKAGGVGLNLTAAEYVIHLDPWWNPAVEMQASDRAHRIGQTKPVFIYKLIARGTVEEKILQLQEKKRALVQSLITTEAGFFKALTRDDVRQLFE